MSAWVLVGGVNVAFAQGGPAAAPTAAQPSGAIAPKPPANAVPPDVVRLKNGGMLRGSINELSPGQYVDITLGSGETRRIPMAEVTYAGPSQDAPSPAATEPAGAELPPTAAPSAAPPQAPAATTAPPARATTQPSATGQVELKADLPNVRFHVREAQLVGQVGSGHDAWSTDAYRELCTAPCSVPLEPGQYTFGLSLPDQRPVRVEAPVQVDAGAVLEGKYKSYKSLRTAGYVTAIGSAALATTMFILSMNFCDTGDADPSTLAYDSPDCGIDPVLVIASGGVALAGGIAGWVMIAQKDEVSVQPAGTKSARSGTSALVGVRGAF